jgi:hypothetical protein
MGIFIPALGFEFFRSVNLARVVLFIVLAGLALILLVAAIVYLARMRRFRGGDVDYEAMDRKADVFVDRGGGGL